MACQCLRGVRANDLTIHSILFHAKGVLLPEVEDTLVAERGSQSQERITQRKREETVVEFTPLGAPPSTPMEPERVSFQEFEPKRIALDNPNLEPIVPIGLGPLQSFGGTQSQPPVIPSALANVSSFLQQQHQTLGQLQSVSSVQQAFGQSGTFGQSTQITAYPSQTAPYGQQPYMATGPAAFIPQNLIDSVSRVVQNLPTYGQQPALAAGYGQAYPATTGADLPWGAMAPSSSGPVHYSGDGGHASSNRGRGGSAGGSFRGKPGLRPGGGYENPRRCNFFASSNCRQGSQCWNLHLDAAGNLVEPTVGSRQLEGGS